MLVPAVPAVAVVRGTCPAGAAASPMATSPVFIQLAIANQGGLISAATVTTLATRHYVTAAPHGRTGAAAPAVPAHAPRPLLTT